MKIAYKTGPNTGPGTPPTGTNTISNYTPDRTWPKPNRTWPKSNRTDPIYDIKTQLRGSRKRATSCCWSNIQHVWVAVSQHLRSLE